MSEAPESTTPRNQDTATYFCRPSPRWISRKRSAAAVDREENRPQHQKRQKHLEDIPQPPKSAPSNFSLARPIGWSGRGELLQLPWKLPIAGTVLCIDMWAGFSGTILALLALGVRIIAIALEVSEDCIDIARVFPKGGLGMPPVINK